MNAVRRASYANFRLPNQEKQGPMHSSQQKTNKMKKNRMSDSPKYMMNYH